MELPILFFIIAFVYASVGFGGGSSYLAVLALYGIPFAEIRLTALLCNIVVVTGGVYWFWRNGHLSGRRALPLILCSVPLAFLGARLKISEGVFFTLLGWSLIAAALLLWLQKEAHTGTEQGRPLPVTPKYAVEGSLLGGGIGFLSGMVGIGGGIFLSPVLNLLRWDTTKRIAATASLFILVNSVAGLAGQLVGLSGGLTPDRSLMLAVTVLIGGQLGSRLGSSRFNPQVVRRMTAVLVLIAGIEALINKGL